MIRRPAYVVLLVLTASSGCEKKAVGTGDSLTQLPSRAAATGDFPDNPLLAFAPSDTPYAFATFKPVPADLLRKFLGMAQPIWRKAFGKAVPDDSSIEQRVMKDVVDVLEHLDIKMIEDHGFSTKARFALYGLGAYPVMRAEILDGARVFELVKLAAERWQLALPPATERAGARYWLIDQPEISVLVAIRPKDFVLALAPHDVLETNLAAVLGEQKPASSLTTAQLRAIAERDGFTGQGVGFVDLARVSSMAAAKLAAAPACGEAIAALARRMPRIAFGYDDLTTHRMAFGVVVELAPDVLAEAKGLTGKLAGLDKLLASHPMMAFAAALDVEHARTAVARAAGTFGDLGQRCQAPELVEVAGKVATTMAQPLPPFLAGLHGGYAVLDHMTMTPQGPQAIEGFGSVQLDHAAELLKLAAAEIPNLDIPPDGKPHVLPSSAIPFPGHAAASDRMIGVAVGQNSAKAAVTALQGSPAPAPLLVMAYDYGRLLDLIPTGGNDVDMQAMRDMFKAFGMAAMQIIVDARGVVWWMSFEMK